LPSRTNDVFYGTFWSLVQECVQLILMTDVSLTLSFKLSNYAKVNRQHQQH